MRQRHGQDGPQRHRDPPRRAAGGEGRVRAGPRRHPALGVQHRPLRHRDHAPDDGPLPGAAGRGGSRSGARAGGDPPALAGRAHGAAVRLERHRERRAARRLAARAVRSAGGAVPRGHRGGLRRLAPELRRARGVVQPPGPPPAPPRRRPRRARGAGGRALG